MQSTASHEQSHMQWFKCTIESSEYVFLPNYVYTTMLCAYVPHPCCYLIDGLAAVAECHLQEEKVLLGGLTCNVVSLRTALTCSQMLPLYSGHWRF